MLPGGSTSLTALFHGCGSHLKLLECVVDGTGEVVLEVRRLQKTDVSSYQQKEQAHHSSAGGKSVSCCPRKADLPKTVARRLRGGELYARRPVVCVPLTRQHRTARLQWCREHHNWTEQDWACVLFSDERRFSLSSDCRRQLIWRENWYCLSSENIQEKDRYPTCIIMVWAGIMINGRTRLHVVANGTMTGQRYIDEVLLPQSIDCLDSEGIQRLAWPARSPDLNPIENVWDALGRQVAGRNYPPTNKNTLIRALTEEWDKLPQQLLDIVVQTPEELQFELQSDHSVKEMFHAMTLNDCYKSLSAEKFPNGSATSGEALKTTRPELTHLRILWDLEQEEDHQQGGYIDDVENDLKTLNIKNWQRVAAYRWNWRQPRPVIGCYAYKEEVNTKLHRTI
ncbi:transposable element Tcb2 transposase [Trichonephila clavipes]|nr:transposable element Tcb2 transposase [Trichonephila clavipes]